MVPATPYEFRLRLFIIDREFIVSAVSEIIHIAPPVVIFVVPVTFPCFRCRDIGPIFSKEFGKVSRGHELSKSDFHGVKIRFIAFEAKNRY
jgi:hypothetical protein